MQTQIEQVPVVATGHSYEEMRLDRRIGVSIRALCHAHGSFSTVQIVDVSAGGCALRGCKSLMPGDMIVIELLNSRKLYAKVRWWLHGTCGVQLTARLDPADALLTRGDGRETNGARRTAMQT